jgi:hypothetical protein
MRFPYTAAVPFNPLFDSRHHWSASSSAALSGRSRLPCAGTSRLSARLEKKASYSARSSRFCQSGDQARAVPRGRAGADLDDKDSAVVGAQLPFPCQTFLPERQPSMSWATTAAAGRRLRQRADFRCQVEHLWYRVLWRRSQRRTSWDRYVRLLERFPLPQPHLIAAPVVVAR